MSSFGFVALLLSQIVLFTLHYGNSTMLGINWSELPWFVVFFPSLACVLWGIVLIFVIAVIWR